MCVSTSLDTLVSTDQLGSERGYQATVVIWYFANLRLLLHWRQQVYCRWRYLVETGCGGQQTQAGSICAHRD